MGRDGRAGSAVPSAGVRRRGILFNSIEFLVFIAVFLAVWPLARAGNARRWLCLTAASFFFYGWWDWRYLFLLIGSGLVDFAAGLLMVRRPGLRRPLLVASIAANLGALATFKYLDFVVENCSAVLRLVGIEQQFAAPALGLPIGISFYTFQSMSYTIDVYRGRLQPTRNPLHFFAYLSLFPQLVAGPIVRASDLLPQLARPVRATEQQRWDGLRLIVQGYFKKVVIADALAPVVGAAFSANTVVDSAPYLVDRDGHVRGADLRRLQRLQ